MPQEQGEHSLNLKNRKKLTMTGVTEVVSFDDTAVELRTALGDLTVQGTGLQLKELSVQGGQVEVTGDIGVLSYQEPRQGGGWLRRMLG